MMHDLEDNSGSGAPTTSNNPAVQRDDNVFENVHIGEDVVQFIGSTSGRSTSAKSISVKPRSIQFLGDLSDLTAQKISSDCRATAREDAPQKSRTDTFAGRGQALGSGPIMKKDANK